MENPNKLLLIISILTLLAVGFSYINLKTSIEQQAESELQAVPATSITVSGVGSKTTFSSGSGNCTTPLIKAEASIVGGAVGNSIKVKAKCFLSNWSAETTSTDSGGAAVYTSKTATGGRGAASCTPTYSSTGAPDSAWTAVCSF